MKPDGSASDSVQAEAAVDLSRECELCPLDAIRCGEAAHIVRLAGAPRTMRRLAALGMRPSARCQVLGRSPAGGPLHLLAGSVHLMLRAEEACDVLVRREASATDANELRTL